MRKIIAKSGEQANACNSVMRVETNHSLKCVET